MSADPAFRAILNMERATIHNRIHEVSSMLATAEEWIERVPPQQGKRPGATRRALIAIAKGLAALERARTEEQTLSASPNYMAQSMTARIIDEHLQLAAARFGEWSALSAEADTRKKSGSVRSEDTRRRDAERNRQIEALAAGTSRTGSGLGALHASTVGLAPDTLARKIRKARRPT